MSGSKEEEILERKGSKKSRKNEKGEKNRSGKDQWDKKKGS